jgi:hypothetical protein
LDFQPRPIDTSGVALPAELLALTELLARHTHDTWARQRLAEGWRYGPRRDEARREHPGLVPYDELPESEQEYDRATALEALRAVVALGYRIEAAAPAGGGGRVESR